MSRKALCTLSTANLLHNLSVLKARAPHAKVMAMVKANAYGHGLRSVAQRLQGRVDALGVASIDEALALRQAGVTTPITLIEGVFAPEEYSVAASQGFTVVLRSTHQIEWLLQTTPTQPLAAWVKINTGMGRLGFSIDEAPHILERLSSCSQLQQPVGLMSHFACADDPSHLLNAKQIAAFAALAKDHVGPKSFCNSAATFSYPQAHYDWIRPGLALYGASPLSGQPAQSLDLKPVMTFQTELIDIQHFKAGDTVGYGARFICPEDMPVGIAAVGYGDGFPRLPHATATVLVQGTSCRILGRVAMDMMAIDLRCRPASCIGETVTLWGESLPVEQQSSPSGACAYDLLTGVQNRVKFLWND